MMPKKLLRRMKTVALAKGRYRTGIIKSASRSSVARANALNVHDCGHQAYFGPCLASFLVIRTQGTVTGSAV